MMINFPFSFWILKPRLRRLLLDSSATSRKLNEYKHKYPKLYEKYSLWWVPLRERCNLSVTATIT